MDELSTKLMAYIDTEVRAACERKGWGSQIRRKWSVRDKPVSESSVDDYEWKLIPDAHGRLPEQEPLDGIDEGIYYVLRLDRRAKKLVLQHDTEHFGDDGLHFFQESFTEIQLVGLGLGDADYMRLLEQVGDSESKGRVPVPPQGPGAHAGLQHGRLRDYLVDLTSRFKPNHFSIT
jgi:hypothetical protein